MDTITTNSCDDVERDKVGEATVPSINKGLIGLWVATRRGAVGRILEHLGDNVYVIGWLNEDGEVRERSILQGSKMTGWSMFANWGSAVRASKAPHAGY